MISVIIPSFNHRPFIGAAIESVLAQNHPPDEVIVVDDGSTDGSASWIAERYGGKIEKIISRPNQGAHAAINEGIEQARGKFVSILNSDDVYASNRLSMLMAAANADDLDIVFSDIQFLDGNGSALSDHKIAKAYARTLNAIGSLKIEEALVRQNFVVTTSNLFIRRNVFDRIGRFRGFKLCHDWDFLLRATGNCKFGRIAKPLLGYRRHDRNTISHATEAQLSAENALVYLSYLLNRNPGGNAVTEDFIFQAEPFEPLAIAWLLTESRRIGLDRLILEAEKSELHTRMAKVFNRNGLSGDEHLSTRRLKRKIRGRVRTWIEGWRS